MMLQIDKLKVHEQNKVLRAQLELIWYHLAEMESLLTLSHAITDSPDFNEGFSEATDLGAKMIGDLINRMQLT